jgi:outer membrane protein assembly factor BamE (lipoprotein component of BamABCDE complex)
MTINKFHSHDAEEDQPSQRLRRKKVGVPVWVWLVCGGFGVVLLLALVGMVGALLLFRGDRIADKTQSPFNAGVTGSHISDASFQQLKLGMRLDQVQAVLGEGEPLTDGEIPPALRERIDDPKITAKIDLVEPQRWRRWGGGHETIFVGLSQTKTGDRVTVLAFDKASSLKLECGNTFGGETVATKPDHSSQRAGRANPGEAKATRPSGKATEEQLRQALTKENYDKLRKGLTEQEVRDILGPPVTNRVLERHAGFEARQLTWRLGQTYIIVAFHNGKLADMDSGNGSGGPLPSANSSAPGPCR